ncbi:MAG: class I SAM-dependent methyltransferase [bacterium]
MKINSNSRSEPLVCEAATPRLREPCPLCDGMAGFLVAAAGRWLYACPQCDLWFVPAAQHWSVADEQARYRLHCNRLDDTGYTSFLQPVINCVAALDFKDSTRHPEVLDYGCGPTPVLVEMLQRAGFPAVGYDPAFAPALDPRRRFDVVVSTETIEHFRCPRDDWTALAAHVRPGGTVVTMTELHDDVQDPSRWAYANDGTHVAFYSTRTMACLAERLGWKLAVCDRRRLSVFNAMPSRVHSVVARPTAQPAR